MLSLSNAFKFHLLRIRWLMTANIGIKFRSLQFLRKVRSATLLCILTLSFSNNRICFQISLLYRDVISVARLLRCMFIISVFGIAVDINLNIDISGPQQDSSSGWCDVKKSRRSQSWLLILTCRESYVKFW